MKRITKSIIAVFAVATVLVSCSKEDSAPATSTDPMVGNWMVDNAVISVPDSAPETVDVNGTCPDKSYLNMKTDGTFEEGDVNSQTCAFTILKGAWKKTDSSLNITLTSGAAVAGIDIISVTANKLALKINNYPNFPPGTFVVYNYTKKQ